MFFYFFIVAWCLCCLLLLSCYYCCCCCSTNLNRYKKPRGEHIKYLKTTLVFYLLYSFYFTCCCFIKNKQQKKKVFYTSSIVVWLTPAAVLQIPRRLRIFLRCMFVHKLPCIVGKQNFGNLFLLFFVFYQILHWEAAFSFLHLKNSFFFCWNFHFHKVIIVRLRLFRTFCLSFCCCYNDV